MVILIYSLCAVTALVCTGLLLRGYYKTKYKLLFWAGLCFCLQTANNVLLVIDKAIVPSVDLLSWRLLIAVISLTLLIVGLIWDFE